MTTPDTDSTVVSTVVAIRPRSRRGTFQRIDGTSKADNPPARNAPRRLFLPSVGSPRGVRRAYTRVMSWILAGQIDTGSAYAICACLTGIGKIMETEALRDLEQQVKSVGEQQGQASAWNAGDSEPQA